MPLPSHILGPTKLLAQKLNKKKPSRKKKRIWRTELQYDGGSGRKVVSKIFWFLPAAFSATLKSRRKKRSSPYSSNFYTVLQSKVVFFLQISKM